MENNVAIEYEAIGITEQRNLINMARGLSAALTIEEYRKIMFVYKQAVDRLTLEAEKQGIKI